jgi:demethoxyubiquinone hydroxylase (CLK1/Coq7/Cat5 family)
MDLRLSRPLRRLRRKLILALWLGRCARQGALVLALAGSAVLLARVAFELGSQEALWLLTPLVLVPFNAWRGVRDRVPTEEGAAAWLDLRSGAEGILLAEFEQGDERWAARLGRQLDRLPELPALRMGAFLRPLAPALAFALVALFVPLSKAAPATSTTFFDQAIEGLADQLEVLELVADLDEQSREELQRRIEELAANVDAEKPEAMLEAIDSLRQQLGLEARDAARLAQTLFDRFGAIGDGAFADSELGQELMSAQLGEVLQSGLLSGALENLDTLAPELTGLAQKLGGDRLQLPEGFQLSPEQMKALSKLARSKLREAVGELDLAGLISLADLQLGDSRNALRELIEKFHKHDEDCKKPGGT